MIVVFYFIADIEIYSHLQTSIQDYCTKDQLNAPAYKILTDVQDFLKNFHDVTKAKKRQKNIIDIMFLIKDFLLEILEEEVEKY